MAAKRSKARAYLKLQGRQSIDRMRRRNLRESIYQREWERNGMVPCYVCRCHVKRHEATLEHIIPRSLGGTDSPKNIAISHCLCNSSRGSMPVAHVMKG